MKSFLYNLAAVTFGSPVIVTGRGLQHAGTGLAKAGNSIHAAGVVTEITGESIKGSLQAKAEDAAVNAAAVKADKEADRKARLAEVAKTKAEEAARKADTLAAAAEEAAAQAAAAPRQHLRRADAPVYAAEVMIPA